MANVINPQKIDRRFAQCLIFAHRGASTEAMENTRLAFDKALNYAIDGIETDVQLSRDEVTVLWHDQFLDRIGLADKHIDDFDYTQLKKLNFPQTGDEGILTLQSFLNHYRQRCRLLIEVKNHDWEPANRHEKKMAQTLNLIGREADDRIIVSSFNLPSLAYAHQHSPQFPLIYNLGDHHAFFDIQQILTSYSFLFGFCLPIAILNPQLVNLLRSQDKCIAVYTCNRDDEIRKALQLEVDILISDVPQKALKMRDTT